MKNKKHHLDLTRKEERIAVMASFFDRKIKEIDTVYIHGSFLRDVPFSDVDMGLIARDYIKDVVGFEIRLEVDLEQRVGYPFDVRLLNSAPLSFCHRVIKEGRVAFDRNPVGRAEFEGLTLKKYFDFHPFRRRYLEDISVAPV
jgi:predicted nucleotidyltransferase